MAKKKNEVYLCEYCIEAIRSHGERVLDSGEIIDEEEAQEQGLVCFWCKDDETELHICKF